jgi:hypothetical protein
VAKGLSFDEVDNGAPTPCLDAVAGFLAERANA